MNAFGVLMCAEICDGASTGICDGVPLTCSSLILKDLLNVLHCNFNALNLAKSDVLCPNAVLG